MVWLNETRAGRSTKVPYCPSVAGRRRLVHASSTDRATWGTRAQAELAREEFVGRRGGGIGVVLGDLGRGQCLGGVDLDTCRDVDGRFEPWASKIIERFRTYFEVSPSGRGAKLYFWYRIEDLAELRASMDGKLGKAFKREGNDHPPAIELYLGGRYFAVTEDPPPTAPNDLRLMSANDLLWLIRQAGPEFVGQSSKGGRSRARGTDNSRSALALRKGVVLRRKGCTFDEMVRALRADPETAEWCQEKGHLNDDRELRRIWDKGAVRNWRDRCQLNSEGALRSNLANTILALREEPSLVGMFAYDEMQRSPFLMRPLDSTHDVRFVPRPVSDVDVTAVQERIQLLGLSSVSKDTVHAAVDLCAVERSFHPGPDWLKSLKWDGKQRSWLSD